MHPDLYNAGKIRRPKIEADTMLPAMKTLIEKCWTEYPSDRPDMSKIRNEIRKINGGK